MTQTLLTWAENRVYNFAPDHRLQSCVTLIELRRNLENEAGSFLRDLEPDADSG